jgi:polysaccharide pyruvyl transferase WcaK-like protein
VLAIGDIGHSNAYHVGDEAMMSGLLEAAEHHRLGIDWTVVSAEPSRSSAVFRLQAVSTFGFAACLGADDREAMLSRLDDVLAAPVKRWPKVAPAEWSDTLESVARNDAVVIAGGGNLSHGWPNHVFERVALVRAARSAGRPLAITGQTIGPFFGTRNRQLVAEILLACHLVGVREEHSYQLASDLGVPADQLEVCFDDAVGLEPAEPEEAASIVGDGSFIAVTLNAFGHHESGDEMIARLARQLVELAVRTSTTIVLVPHVGDLAGRCVHDAAVAFQALSVAGDGTRLRVAPLPSPHQAVWYCRHAAMVVSSRYHPIVFASAGGTPALFLSQDSYTKTKGEGALRLVGQDRWSLSLTDAGNGMLLPTAMDLWACRAAVRQDLEFRRDHIVRASRAHLAKTLATVLGIDHRPDGAMAISPAPVPTRSMLTMADLELDDADRRLEAATARVSSLERRVRAAEDYAATLEQRVQVAEEYAADLSKSIQRKDGDLSFAQARLAELGRQGRSADEPSNPA